MNSPLVSIVIPTYKAARYIGECIQSIFAQTYVNWEIIIGEDGCFDDTCSIINSMRPPSGQYVHMFTNQSNYGVSYTRNRAMEKAQGRYIAFLDADDTWEPEHLEQSLQHIVDNRAEFVFSGNNFINEVGKVTKRDEQPSEKQLSDVINSIYTYNFIMTPAVVIDRKIIDDGYRFDESLRYGEDLDIWIRIIGNGYRWTYLAKATYNYRKHATSAMSQTPAMIEGMLEFYRKHFNNPDIRYSLRKHKFSEYLYSHGKMCRRMHPERARRAFSEYLRLKPFDIRGYGYWLLSYIQSKRIQKN